MSNFLDKTGLSYFWSKIKGYIDTKIPSNAGNGKVLTSTADGNVWKDPEAFVLNITVEINPIDDTVTYEPDKTFDECASALSAGRALICALGVRQTLPLMQVGTKNISESGSLEILLFHRYRLDMVAAGYAYEVTYYSDGTLDVKYLRLTADELGIDPDAEHFLMSSTVNDAIYEVNQKVEDLEPADIGAADRNFRQSAVFGTSSAAYHGWIEVGRVLTNTAYRSLRTIFLVNGVNGRGSGILSFSMRTDGTPNVLGGASKLYWLTLDDPAMEELFAVEQDGDYAVLYLKLTGTYQCYHIDILGYGWSNEEFTDPTDSDLFKMTSNYNATGNRKDEITAKLTSSIALTYSMVGAASYSHTHSASGITSGTLPVSRGGTGETSVGGTDYTDVRFRGSGLRSSDTNPSTNGTINWTYG